MTEHPLELSTFRTPILITYKYLAETKIAMICLLSVSLNIKLDPCMGVAFNQSEDSLANMCAYSPIKSIFEVVELSYHFCY